MWLLTPKISWITTTAPRGFPLGSARYAASLCPSAAVSSIILPMATASSWIESAIMKKKREDLFRLASEALRRAGAHQRMAETTAEHLVRAEEQGLPTHGMSRVPFYCAMLRNGRADGAARPELIADKGAVCLIDNADGLPYEWTAWALEQVIQRARRNGIAFAGIRNS